MTQVLGLSQRSGEYSPLLPNAVCACRIRPICGVTHCNACKQMRRKSLANACLYEMWGFSPSSMRLQPSLDKTWHQNKKEQEITQQFEDSMGLIAQSQEPSASRDAWEDPHWSSRGPMVYLLALCRCFNCPGRICIVSIHWAKLNPSAHFLVKYLPIAPTVLQVCMRSLLWPCASASFSSQVLTAGLNGGWHRSIIITLVARRPPGETCARELCTGLRDSSFTSSSAGGRNTSQHSELPLPAFHL